MRKGNKLIKLIGDGYIIKFDLSILLPIIKDSLMKIENISLQEKPYTSLSW